MPLFEYRCKNCGRRFEALVYGSDRASCPECGGTDLEQEISSFAVSRSSGTNFGGGPTSSSCGSSTSGGG